MIMLQRFYPHHEVDSAYVIDYEGLYQAGFRGVIFDIDNTLVPHGAPADKRAVELIARLKACGFQVLFLSNNKEPRVKQFNDAVGASYIYKAGKPKTAGYYRAMERLGTRPENTMFVGDQLFTDIWGAKKAGMETWLVKPIHPKEEIQIVLKRRLEKIVLYFYHRRRRDSGKKQQVCGKTTVEKQQACGKATVEKQQACGKAAGEKQQDCGKNSRRK